MQKIIYHLHDVCCNHSSLTLDDAVSYALKHGYETLYWSEHCPISVPCGYAKRRPKFSQLVDLTKRIAKYNKKYQNKLHIYFGYEVEFNKANRWYFEKLARDPLCQYLILGIHFYGNLFKDPWPYPYCINDTHTQAQIKEYLEMWKAGVKSGLMSWAPHPEIWLNSYAKWDETAENATKQIINLAIKTGTPLAFNINFKDLETKSDYHYPSPYFWKVVANSPIKVIIESDAHALDKIKVKWLNQGRKMAQSFGIDKNIVDTIPIKWLPKKPLLVLYEQGLVKYLSDDLLTTLKNNKVPFVEINESTNLLKVCKEHNVHPVWTLGLIKNTSLLAKAKKTSMYIVSNLKGADISLDNILKLDYQKFIETEFIKEVK